MTTIEFGDWSPDLGSFGASILREARNCIPQAAGYRWFPGLSVHAGPGALPAAVLSGFSAKDRDGNTVSYAAVGGDANEGRLYRLAASAWSDASGTGSDGIVGYSINAGENWEFVKWGESVLATCINEPLQQHMFGAGAFASMISSARRPRARHVAVIRDFVVLGNIDDSVGAGADGLAPSRVWWSGINDAATFEEGGAAAQSDFQDLQSGGPVQRIVGGEIGTVFCESSIYRMTYVGAPVVFQFDEVERNRGVWVPGSVATAGRLTFFLDRDGWYVWDGQASTPIGHNKIDRSFLSGSDAIAPAHLDRVTAVADPVNQLYYCAYPSVNAQGGNPDRILVFDWGSRKWSIAELGVDCLFRAFSEGYTIDNLDTVAGSIDALEVSLDSAVYTGRDVSLAAFDQQHRLAFFSGAPLAAILETGDVQLAAGADGRSLVTSVRPIVERATVASVQPLTRDRATDEPLAGDIVPVDGRGACLLRANSRYHRFRVRLGGAFSAATGLRVAQVASAGDR